MASFGADFPDTSKPWKYLPTNPTEIKTMQTPPRITRYQRAQQVLVEIVALVLLGVGMLAMLYILTAVHV